MIWLVASLACAVLALGAARLLAGHFAWTLRKRKRERDRRLYPGLYRNEPLGRPDGWQWFGGWCMALLVVVVSPLLIVPWLVGRKWQVGAELAERRRAAEERVKELERELGL